MLFDGDDDTFRSVVAVINGHAGLPGDALLTSATFGNLRSRPFSGSVSMRWSSRHEFLEIYRCTCARPWTPDEKPRKNPLVSQKRTSSSVFQPSQSYRTKVVSIEIISVVFTFLMGSYAYGGSRSRFFSGLHSCGRNHEKRVLDGWVLDYSPSRRSNRRTTRLLFDNASASCTPVSFGGRSTAAARLFLLDYGLSI